MICFWGVQDQKNKISIIMRPEIPQIFKMILITTLFSPYAVRPHPEASWEVQKLYMFVNSIYLI